MTDHNANNTETGNSIDPQQLAALHKDMLHFARLQLRDEHLAEDAVQDTLAAALKSDRFRGEGALKSWVFAILRNKIIDVIRERSRHPAQPLDENDDALADKLFKDNGHWRRDQRPNSWQHPDECLEDEQFWRIFEACLSHLPENPARVFMMREHLGLEVTEICEELHISNSNCWVLIHRARMRLRQCLNENFM